MAPIRPCLLLVCLLSVSGTRGADDTPSTGAFQTAPNPQAPIPAPDHSNYHQLPLNTTTRLRRPPPQGLFYHVVPGPSETSTPGSLGPSTSTRGDWASTEVATTTLYNSVRDENQRPERMDGGDVRQFSAETIPHGVLQTANNPQEPDPSAYQSNEFPQNTSTRVRRPPPQGLFYRVTPRPLETSSPRSMGPSTSTIGEWMSTEATTTPFDDDGQDENQQPENMDKRMTVGQSGTLGVDNSSHGALQTPYSVDALLPADTSAYQSDELPQSTTARLHRPPPQGSLYTLPSETSTPGSQGPSASDRSEWTSTKATTTQQYSVGRDDGESQQREEGGDLGPKQQFGIQDALDYWDVLRESQISGFEASIEVALTDVQSDRCKEETREFLKGLRNFTLWATQMFDASVKYPLGILSGNVYNMGDFDECLSVRGPGDIRGRYCLARVAIKEPAASKARRKLRAPATPDPFAIWLDPTTSTWEQIEYKGARWKHRRDSAFWAMCLPSSCSALDLQTVMNHVLPPLGFENGIHLEVTVQPHHCSQGPPSPHTAFAASDWAFCIIIALAVIASISATFFDFRRQKADSRPTPLQSLFLCFSMRKNFVSLHRATNKDGLKAVFGIRVLSMVMIIMCHKYGVTIGGATTNGQYIEEGNRQIPYMLTLHGDLVVDTFFAVGAFLLVYSTLKEWEAGKGAGLGAMFFLRYIRLTPAYALVIFFYGTLLNKVASGPLWNSTVAHEATFCARHWWTNLLYVSNYVNTQQMCMVQSWYLPCDMHFFVLSLPLLVLLHRRPRAGQLALALFALAALAAPLAITLAGKHDATILFYQEFLSNPRASRYFHAMYTKSHTRAGPYVAGFIAGYIFHKKKLYETKISRATARALFALSVLVFGAVLFPAVAFYTPERQYDAAEAAIYAALQRFAWGSAVALLILALASGKIRCVSTMLSWTPFVALGKLTYCAYLIHFTFQLIGLGADRNPNYVTNYNVLLKSTGETVFTFIVALVLYLMVEAPFRDIGRLLVLAAATTRRKPRMAPETPAVAAGCRGPAAPPPEGSTQNHA